MFALNTTLTSLILGLALFALPVSTGKSAPADCCCKDVCACTACECAGDCSGSCCGDSGCSMTMAECAPKATCGEGCCK